MDRTKRTMYLFYPTGEREVYEPRVRPLRSTPAWSPDGRQVAVPEIDGLAVWDVTGRLLGRVALASHAASSPPAFLPPGDAVIAFINDPVKPDKCDFIIWEPAKSRLVRQPLKNVEATPYSGQLRVSPDGRTLAVLQGRFPRFLKWDLSSFEVRFDLVGHNDNVTDAAFAPDSRTFATASLDRTVRLWNVASGQEVLSLEGHFGPVRALAFAPDGRALAACGDGPEGSTEVIVWRARGTPKPKPPRAKPDRP
jgi:WD40 repeat protein